MLKCIFVGVGGFVGSVLRYLIGLLPIEAKNDFPFKTLLINVAGAFIIGLIAAAAAKNENINENVILMLKVGICGGFTTFSTFAYETTNLLQKGNIITAITYITSSIVLGVFAVYVSEYFI